MAPERDAFGREVGEDSLASLGWGPGGPAAQAGVPAAAAPPPARPVAPGAATSSRAGGRGSSRAVARVVAAGVVLAGLGGAAAGIVGTVDGVDHAVRAVGHGVSVALPATARDRGEPPAGLHRGSLLRADALGPALATLRARGGRPQTLRVAADRVDATVAGRDGRLHVLQATWRGGVRDVGASATPAGLPTFAWADVDARAPQHAVAGAAAARRTGATRVDYVVLLQIGGRGQWHVYFRDGAHFSASSSGGHVRRVG